MLPRLPAYLTLHTKNDPLSSLLVLRCTFQKLDPQADIYRVLRRNNSMPVSDWLESQTLASIDIATDVAIFAVFTQILREPLFGVTPIDLAAL